MSSEWWVHEYHYFDDKTTYTWKNVNYFYGNRAKHWQIFQHKTSVTFLMFVMNKNYWQKLQVYAVRRMIWTPESVSTILLNSPTFKANAASSNGFCIAPRPNNPRSPPRLAELQSDTWGIWKIEFPLQPITTNAGWCAYNYFSNGTNLR